MNRLIKKLSPSAELAIILIIGFGYFIYSSTRIFLILNTGYSHPVSLNLTSYNNLYIVSYEVIALLIIGYILKVRHWKIADFNLKFVFKMIWIGLLIMIVERFISGFVLRILIEFSGVGNSSINQVHFNEQSNWIVILFFLVINSFYEEFILLGYLFKRLEKFHPAIIIGFSMVIRLLCHTYQGWAGIIQIIVFGLVFSIYYYKYKKLWPLIIAHGVGNLLVYLSLHFHWLEKLQQ